MTNTHLAPSSDRGKPAEGVTARRRALSRTQCLDWMQYRTVGRLAITVGALPHIAVVRYYLIGETVFIDTGSPDIARSLAGHVVALESGTSDADQQQPTWSVCAVGVVAPSAETPDGETILEMHPELLSGWIDDIYSGQRPGS
jgi:Pyridoxamine 5'-phosphate oxidase